MHRKQCLKLGLFLFLPRCLLVVSFLRISFFDFIQIFIRIDEKSIG